MATVLVVSTFYMGPLVSVNLVTTLNIGRKAVVRRLTALVAEVVITSLVSGPVLLSSCPTIRNASTLVGVVVGVVFIVVLSLSVEVASEVGRGRLVAMLALASICAELFLA